MRRIISLSALVFCAAHPGIAQDADTTSEKEWAFSASANIYLFQESEVLINPVFTIDRKRMHLEARYNYEDLKTGSVFGGYNFSVGNKAEFSATPVLGMAFGNTNGIAPGLIWELNWWRLNLYSESEYLFDFISKDNNFYYAWAELTISPTDWLWLGISAQRTKLYETDLDVQRGIALGFNADFLSITTYIFNIGWDDPFGVVSIEVVF